MKREIGIGDICALNGIEPFIDLAAGVGDGRAIEIGARRCGGCRGVGNFIGARRHDADGVEADAEAFRRNLPDLGVQTLAHLGSAMVHLHGAIAINENQRARLVEESRGK